MDVAVAGSIISVIDPMSKGILELAAGFQMFCWGLVLVSC